MSYKTLRIPEEDYDKLKEIRRLLRQKGAENLDWKALKKQKFIKVKEHAEDTNFTMGAVVGLGATALAYLLQRGLQEKEKDK